MRAAIVAKWRKLVAFVLARLSESSTIQGIAAVLTLGTGIAIDDGKLAGWVALAAFVSAMLKIFLPDRWTKE